MLFWSDNTFWVDALLNGIPFLRVDSSLTTSEHDRYLHSSRMLFERLLVQIPPFRTRPDLVIQVYARIIFTSLRSVAS